MKLTGDWLTRPATQRVLQTLESKDDQAYLVGGCVRNALMGLPVNDIDVATSALPNRVMELAKAAGIRAVPTGLDHGTVTLVEQGIGHEVTTFRADVETDGRHAIVRFSDQIEHDAARRDFTMNALYAKSDGEVVDPLGGLPDLLARRVRFILNPDQRIQEDYLRILRFFRFSAHYGDPQNGMDQEALDAIARNLDGLTGLSRERVGQEVLKLLSAPDPAPAVATMQHTGTLHTILPGANNAALALLVHQEAELQLSPDPLSRLAAIAGPMEPDLRLSKKDQKTLAVLRDGVQNHLNPGALGYFHGVATAFSILALRAAMLETPVPPEHIAQVNKGANAQFPLRAADLSNRVQGPALGQALRMAQDRWIASDFTLTKTQLLKEP